VPKTFTSVIVVLAAAASLAAPRRASADTPVPDRPFQQDLSVKIRTAPALAGAVFRKVLVDRDGVVHVLSDRGLARVYDDVLAPDRNFRPLADTKPLDIALSPAGDVYFLLDDQWISNGDTGKPRGVVPPGRYDQLAVDPEGNVWLAGPAGLAKSRPGSTSPETVEGGGKFTGLRAAAARLLAVRDGIPVAWPGATPLGAAGANCVDAQGDRFVAGYPQGRIVGEFASPVRPSAIDGRLPWPDVRRVAAVSGGYWAATSHGAFFESNGSESVYATPEAGREAPAPRFRYYAGRRWLADDDVIDIAVEPGRVWLLSRTGVQAIDYRRWTLEEKAAWFFKKIRSRHIRYGLSAERRLLVPGDVASGEMNDTDNDGGWSSYWLAGQAFRYAVTRDPSAKASAWETFRALERLQTIHTNTGFPARTLERTGFKFSDPDQWDRAKDPGWDWKSHTSSDEIASHMFAYAILWECAADTPEEKRAVAAVVEPIVQHILDHNLYLVDVDGKPTLWGRWNPEYINRIPPKVYDRRLNSSELTAMLELAWKLTGKSKFKDAAFNLFRTAGYLQNITNTMAAIAPAPTKDAYGDIIGDDWNHSDDELGFITYWVLCRFAFTPELKHQFVDAVRDHWNLERNERYPFWNFVASGCAMGGHDTPGAVWTLRGWPLDTVTWRVVNSTRKDITPLPRNFRAQELEEILPPGERQATRCNTQPFILDAGDNGSTEFAGDEFLLGYWMGRFTGDIAPPKR
jgi:hypothetical protein